MATDTNFSETAGFFALIMRQKVQDLTGPPLPFKPYLHPPEGRV